MGQNFLSYPYQKIKLKISGKTLWEELGQIPLIFLDNQQCWNKNATTIAYNRKNMYDVIERSDAHQTTHGTSCARMNKTVN